MGLRFRKSINLGGGARINLSKSGPSLSVGKKGARVTVGKRGVTRTIGIPGTGIYSTKTTGWNNKKGSTKKAAPQKAQSSGGAIAFAFAVGFFIFGCLTLPWGIIAIIIGIVIFLLWILTLIAKFSENHQKSISSTVHSEMAASDSGPTSTNAITLLSITNPAVSGEKAVVEICGLANTEYRITVKYDSSVSRSKGLEPQITNEKGYASWSWMVRTACIKAHIIITGGGQSLETDIQVV